MTEVKRLLTIKRIDEVRYVIIHKIIVFVLENSIVDVHQRKSCAIQGRKNHSGTMKGIMSVLLIWNTRLLKLFKFEGTGTDLGRN